MQTQIFLNANFENLIDQILRGLNTCGRTCGQASSCDRRISNSEDTADKFESDTHGLEVVCQHSQVVLETLYASTTIALSLGVVGLHFQ